MTAFAGLVERRARSLLAALIALSVVVGALGAGAADVLVPYNGDPDSSAESAEAARDIARASGVDPRSTIVALVEPDAPVRSQRGRRAVDEVARQLAADPSIETVVTPFRGGGEAMVSSDGRSAYLLAALGTDDAREQRDIAERLLDRFEAPAVKLGGVGIGYAEGTEISSEDLQKAEQVAFPLLLLAAFLVFRGLAASLLPLLVGGLSVVWTLAMLRVLGELLPVSVFALNLVTALGLGLAIDFSLLLVSRYREELSRTDSPSDALTTTLQTAGRTVLCSGITIAASLTALLVFPQRLLYSLGLAGLLVSLLTAAIALVSLSCMLALLERRVNALAPRRLQRVADREAQPATAGAWYRLAQLVGRHPAAIAAASAALLLVLATPALRLSTTSADTPQELPPSASARQVDDALAERFPPNRTTPVRVVVRAAPSATAGYERRLRALPGVAEVTPLPLGTRLTELQVVSRAPPFAPASLELVEGIRATPAPAARAVGGDTAAFVDQRDSIAAHAGLALAIAAAVSAFVLFFVTGSVVLALKTLVMNVLTVGATMGVLVLAVQDGWVSGVLDFESRDALVDPGVLVYVAALSFGLSTDYAVMLLSRIREEHAAGWSNAEATARGLERTGRIITAAAVLFAIAVGGAVTGQILAVKEAVLGVIIAVAIDATLVRSLLAPALMHLLGEWNWWSPRWLRRPQPPIAAPGGGDLKQ
jgi:uncharacterized membrane protein YdfJ with MMPL/SSD domain